MKKRATPNNEVARPKTQNNYNSKTLAATQPIPFQFESHALRVTLGSDGEPWFNATDVCGVLGHSNTRKAIADHVDAEDVTKCYTLTAGGRQIAMVFVWPPICGSLFVILMEVFV